MAESNLIHCDLCFKQPDESNRLEFLLTQCGRLFCSECYKTNSCVIRQCESCKSNNFAEATPLNSKLPPVVMEFFQNPNVVLKRYCKVLEFQKRRHENWLAHEHRRMEWQCKNLKKSREEALILIENYRSEKNSFIQEINRLKVRVRDLESQIQEKGSSLNTPSKGQSENLRPLPPTHPQSSSTPQSKEELRTASVAPGLPSYSFRSQAPRSNSIPSFGQQTPAFFQPSPASFHFRNKMVQRPSVPYPTPPQPFRVPSRSGQSVSSNSGLSYQRVLSFMTAAAKQALTPDKTQH